MTLPNLTIGVMTGLTLAGALTVSLVARPQTTKPMTDQQMGRMMASATILDFPSVAAAPNVGDRAPDFTLAQIDGKKLALSAELKRGPVVLIVGRGWVGYQCPFCNRQFGDFLKAAGDIEAAGARVVWVYPGPADQVQTRAEEFAAGRPFPPNFRFVLDPSYALTRSYGLRWDAPQETAYPSTFVIDRTGVVRYALVSKSHDGRSSAADVIAALRKIN